MADEGENHPGARPWLFFPFAVYRFPDFTAVGD